jgi:hypothetical protein
MGSTCSAWLKRIAGPAALLALMSAPALAQSGADSAPPELPDSSAIQGYGDRGAQPAVDTGLTSPSESSRAPRGTLRTPAKSPRPAPVDSAVVRACDGVRAGAPALALLRVRFRSGTSEGERNAAARSVGGRLEGTAATGEWYVLLEASHMPLRAAADSLILNPAVAQVSESACPRS